MKATNRLAIIVVQQYPKIALRITLHNSFGIHHRAYDSSYYVISLKFLKGGEYFILGGRKN